MLERLFESPSLPVVTAIATLIAAGIGAVVAIVVAVVNAWSARRVAIDTAHRTYRSELAESSVAATRAMLQQLMQLRVLAHVGNYGAFDDLVKEMTAPRAKVDLRIPHDPVFAQAVDQFVYRREKVLVWLYLGNWARDQTSLEDKIVKIYKYVADTAAILQLAAEAYVFDLKRLRRRARQLQKQLDTTPLRIRIEDSTPVGG